MDQVDFDMWVYIGTNYKHLVHYGLNGQPRDAYATEEEALIVAKQTEQLVKATITDKVVTSKLIAVPCFRCKKWHIRQMLNPATEARLFVESLGIQARW